MKVNSISLQGVGVINEDHLLVGGNVFGVFDGATSLDKYTENGLTGGYLAAKIARDVFAANDRPLAGMFRAANELVNAEMRKRNIDVTQNTSRWNTSVAVVQIHGDELLWLRITDSQILLIFSDGKYQLLGDPEDHDVQTLTMWRDLAKQGEHDLHTKLQPQICKIRNEANQTYGCLNGQPEAEKFLQTGALPLTGVSDIIIFTDGMFIPKEDPESADDWALFIKLYQKGGLEKLAEYVRGLENTDPECLHYPRFKQYDDLTGVSISFGLGKGQK